MRNHKTILIVSTFLLVALSFWFPAFSQDERAAQQKVKVVERLTDVVVRGADGSFVRGLQRSDFRLYVDGEEVTINAIEEFNAVSRTDEAVQNYMYELQRAEEKNLPPPAPPTPPRFIILVFDRYNMGIQATEESKDTAKRFVNEALLPYDQVAVFQFNKVFKHLAGPTADREKINDAIDKVGGTSLNEFYRPQGEEFLAHQSDTSTTSLRNDIRTRRFEMMNIQKQIEFRSYLDALKQLAGSLSFLPGRKSYLLFSEGANIYNPLDRKNESSIHVDDELNQATDSIDITSFNFDWMDFGRQAGIGGYLSTSNSTFYTIRRGPIVPEWTLLVDVDLSAGGNIDELWNADFTQVALDMNESRLEVMRQIALTGGGKFYDAGYVEKKMFASLQDEIGNYYVLAFTIPESKLGKYYKIKIDVPGRDLRVSHRSGFWGAKTFEKLTGKERRLSLETAVLAGAGANDLDMETRFFQMPIPQNQNVFYYLQFDASKLQAGGKGKYELEQIISVEDQKGTLRFRKHKVYHGDSSGGAENLWLTGNVPLLPDISVITIALRDNVSGNISVERKVLNTVVSNDAGLALAQPVFLLPLRGGSIKEWQATEIHEEVGITDPIEFTGIAIPGMPNHLNVFRQGESAPVLIMICNIPNGFDPKDSNIYADFVINCGGKRYRLIQSQMGLQLLQNLRSVACMTAVPIGLAQCDSGVLELTVKGIIEGLGLKTSLPFTISDFSESKAMELASDERLIRISR